MSDRAKVTPASAAAAQAVQLERRASPQRAAESAIGNTKKRPSQGLYVSVSATRTNQPSGARAATKARRVSDPWRASRTPAMPAVTGSSSPNGPYQEAVSLAVVGDDAVGSPSAR